MICECFHNTAYGSVGHGSMLVFSCAALLLLIAFFVGRIGCRSMSLIMVPGTRPLAFGSYMMAPYVI